MWIEDFTEFRKNLIQEHLKMFELMGKKKKKAATPLLRSRMESVKGENQHNLFLYWLSDQILTLLKSEGTWISDEGDMGDKCFLHL